MQCSRSITSKYLLSPRGTLSQPTSPGGNNGLLAADNAFPAGKVTNVVVVPMEQVDSLFLKIPLP